jgi:NAD(P)-dependent dehydrogenase (short-subunit alcohol dehydrogenase family)
VKWDNIFQLNDKVAVVTGGGGVLCSEMCRAMASVGVKVCILDAQLAKAQKVAQEISQAGGIAREFECNALNIDSLRENLDQILSAYGTIDILINGVGGNKVQATTSENNPFFDIPREAFNEVFELNFTSLFLSCQVFGTIFAKNGKGNIINIASLNSIRPLTRIPVYSAAKSAVVNFTQWLAIHMAQEYSPEIRVNAIAPGFFLTDQNRYLLKEVENGNFTPRARQILSHTPMNRCGEPDDLVGTTLWLASAASKFVTGIVVPVDGGFLAYSGV